VRHQETRAINPAYNSIVRNFCLLLIFAVITAGRMAAQCSAAPADFAATCQEIQAHLKHFDALVNSGWKGTRSPVAFATELLAANDNRGLHALLRPNTINAVRGELRGFAKVGVQAVTMAVGFPILYKPFYEFNKDPQDYDAVLSFYKSVMAELRKRGLKVVIESSVMFPTFARDVPLAQYYATLSESQIIAGRAQVAETVARELKPDWLNLGSEPDTQAALLRMRSGYPPRQYGEMIAAIVHQLRKAGIQAPPLIGAGVGAWRENGGSYIKELTKTGVDYIDLHIYSVNLDYVDNLVKFIDQAQAAGKRVGISEAWMKKVSDAELRGRREFGIIKLLNSARQYDSFSFWAPLDSEFIEDLVKLAHWKNLYFVSPFSSPLFFSYTDYRAASQLEPAQRYAENIKLSMEAMRKGELSPTGKAYAAAIKSPRR
jgi:hypothetical protein